MKNTKKLMALALSLVLMLCAMTGAMAESFESTIDWAAEYDVVVIGYGAAGAASAVNAVEAGAKKVLILEKAPQGHEGGNSRYAAQLVLNPSNKETALVYYKNLRTLFDNQTDEILEYVVDGLCGTGAWMEAHGAKLFYMPFPEYPELEGSSAATAFLVNGKSWDAGYLKFLQSLVEEHKDQIDVWYETPGVQLIQDKATKIVHGVVAVNNGQQYNIRAKNGVVMAMGGFENSDEMLENYCQLSNAYSKGARYNTGDGVKMAIDVGADLWHMSALSGNDVNFVNPETGISAGYALTNSKYTGYATGFSAQAMMIVGGDGTRFCDETCFPRHGHTYKSGTWYTQQIPDNSWCVFDETARTAVPAYPSWSEGMVDEIEKGWVVKADTLEELAGLMGVPAENLVAEVEKYNVYCETGVDIEFGKGPEHVASALKALTTAPYYAFPVKATMTNTQGGAKRNTNCEVVDVWGEAIPHLYSAGEFGSFYTDIYNGGGNLSECLFTGITAGTNAAAVKTDVLEGSVMEDKTAVDFSPVDVVYETAANEYIGKGSGIADGLTVKVTVVDGKMTAIEVIAHNETPGISDAAIAEMPARILEAQSVDIDGVSGATRTSDGIKAAVADALSQSK